MREPTRIEISELAKKTKELIRQGTPPETAANQALAAWEFAENQKLRPAQAGRGLRVSIGEMIARKQHKTA